MSANTKGTTKQRKGREADADYTKPNGSSFELDCRIAGERRGIEARADWIVLRKNDRPWAATPVGSILPISSRICCVTKTGTSACTTPP